MKNILINLMLIVSFFAIDSIVAKNKTIGVSAAIETEPVYAKDGPDDIAIWINSENPERSSIICTNKGFVAKKKDKKSGSHPGLYVYAVNGSQKQYINCGFVNNVDLRYNFRLEDRSIDIAVTGNRTDNTLLIYEIDRNTGLLKDVPHGILHVEVKEIYGLCMYYSTISKKYFVIVSDKKSGTILQYELYSTDKKIIRTKLVRSFSVGGQSEGCVADDDLGFLYIAEENYGLWKYYAEPDSGDTRQLVDKCGSSGNLHEDVEGLTIYYSDNGKGYLIASCQGKDEFAVYRRDSGNEYIGTFTIQTGEKSIDKVTGTDGIDVTNQSINSTFPNGFFIAQDDKNEDIKGTQNFKLVPWEHIAASFNPPLLITAPKITEK